MYIYILFLPQAAAQARKITTARRTGTRTSRSTATTNQSCVDAHAHVCRNAYALDSYGTMNYYVCICIHIRMNMYILIYICVSEPATAGQHTGAPTSRAPILVEGQNLASLCIIAPSAPSTVRNSNINTNSTINSKKHQHVAATTATSTHLAATSATATSTRKLRPLGCLGPCATLNHKGCYNGSIRLLFRLVECNVAFN